MTIQDVKDILKILAPTILAYLGYLKSLTELDVYAACKRAKDSGKCVDSQMYWRWYHRLFFVKKKLKHLEELNAERRDSGTSGD